MQDDTLWYGSSGPHNAKVMVIAESWGSEERAQKLPLVGQAGHIFTDILGEAGINRDELFLTNCFNDQPMNDEAWRFFEKTKESTMPAQWDLYPTPWARDQLRRLNKQIDEVRPEVIIAAGNYSLWANTENRAKISPTKEKKTGKTSGVLGPAGIMNWRGSMLFGRQGQKVLPIIHPAAVMRQWELRAVTIHDLRSRIPMALRNDWVNPKPGLKLAPPTFEEAVDYLENIAPGDLVADVETIPSKGLLVCIGLCQSLDLAISIPFIRVTDKGRTIDSYWTIPQEARLLGLIRRAFVRPDVCVIGQNFVYDQQWILRDIGVLPRLGFDTMLAHHTLWPGTPKGLDYLSSLYRPYHVYWKEDSNEWDVKENGLETELSYNCEDLFATFEIAQELRTLVHDLGFDRQLAEILEENQDLALDMMLRGVRVDEKLRGKMGVDIMLQVGALGQWIDQLFPNLVFGSGSDSMWWESPAQTATMFYDTMGLREVRDRKTKSRSTGKEALEELTNRYPRLRQLFTAIKALRSLDVFHSHFIKAPLEPSGRLSCSYGTTETFRWSSSTNAFKRGTNLQNIPVGNEDGE